MERNANFILYLIPPLLIISINSFLFYKVHFSKLNATDILNKHIESTKKDNELNEQRNHFAFATLVTPAFAMGAVVLGSQLRSFHDDKYDLICIISQDVNETWRKILSQWWKIIPVKEYRPMMHFRRSWMKLYVFELEEYDKIVYLDTDIFVTKPIDELFSYPQLSCVPDVNPPQLCNTGVLVIEPKKGTFEKIDHLARVEQIRMGIGDQSSINAFFQKFTPLPPEYNSPRTIEPGLGHLIELNKSKNIHFICKKPWKCGRENMNCGCGYFEMNRLWWDAWDAACQDHICMESWLELKATKKPKPTKKQKSKSKKR